jgi:3-deoxy-D-manno-octulosonic-acid transferase
VRIPYLLISYLLTPLLLLYLAARGIRDRAYLQRWHERFAVQLPAIPAGGVVVHAASLGEVNAAAPLIHEIARRFPGLAITFTSFTPTGSARIRELFANKVYHTYAPLDLPGAARRFFRRLRPRLLIVMETEIWPNLYFAAAGQGTRIMMANARISTASIGAYLHIRCLTRATLSRVDGIAAQSEADGRRLVQLGAAADRVMVGGNLKFDLELPAELRQHGVSLRQALGEQRPVLLAASTHDGDEKAVLEAFAGLLNAFPRALLLLAPRHPQRFEQAAQQAQAAGLRVQRYSQGRRCDAATQCLLVDVMGALLRCYAACDVAFVGGSLARVGGHNVLEPAALSVPVLVGPHTFNSAEVTRQLLDCGGALRVSDAASLQRAAAQLLGDAKLRQTMGDAGRRLVQSGQGALSRTLGMVERLLDYCSS